MRAHIPCEPAHQERQAEKDEGREPEAAKPARTEGHRDGERYHPEQHAAQPPEQQRWELPQILIFLHRLPLGASYRPRRGQPSRNRAIRSTG